MKIFHFLKTLTLATTIIAAEAASTAMAAPAVASTAEKPVVQILFRHTAENPYDIRLLSYLGGMAARVEIVPHTDKALVIAYNTGDLHGAKITGAAPTKIGFVSCKNGKTTVMFDLLCVEARKDLLPGLVTRLSSIPEWKMALELQERGQLDKKSFARAPLTNELQMRYAAN